MIAIPIIIIIALVICWRKREKLLTEKRHIPDYKHDKVWMPGVRRSIEIDNDVEVYDTTIKILWIMFAGSLVLVIGEWIWI